MAEQIAVVDVIIPPVPVVSVASVGVAGPPGPAGPEGPAGPAGPAGTIPADITADTIALGVNPAQSGAVRLANNAGITYRHSSNTLDLTLIEGRVDSAVHIGDEQIGAASYAVFHQPPYSTYPITTTNSLSVGVNPSQSGAVRLANNAQIKARDAANSGDAIIAYLDEGNNLQIAPSGVNAVGISANLYANQAVNVTQSVAIGVNPSQTGAVRLANQGQIKARNAANTADLPVVRVDQFNGLEFAVLNTPSYFMGLLQARQNVQIFSGYLNMNEITAPGNAPANNAYIYMDDNGSGKSRLMIRFATGAAVQIAIEP